MILKYLLSEKENFIRHAIFNDTRFWTIKEKYIHEMNVIEIKNIKMDKWKYKKR